MIKHIVMWKIKDNNDSSSKINVAHQIKSELEALNGQIQGVLRLEVGIDFLKSEASYDVVLYSEFESKEALDHYQNHPLHIKVANDTIKPMITSRIVVDYEI